MKKTISILFVLLSVSLFGQTKRVELSSDATYSYSVEHQMIVDIEAKDTIEAVVIYFSNIKYRSITDLRIISFVENERLEQFKKDLSAAIENIGTKDAIKWDREDYTISVSGKRIYLYDEDKGCTMMNLKHSKRLLEYLKPIKFKEYNYN